jgi:hypothetical protein
MRRDVFFNFPVTLLRGFTNDEKRPEVLRHILYYATYVKALAIENANFNSGMIGFVELERALWVFEDAAGNLLWDMEQPESESNWARGELIYSRKWHFNNEETWEEAVTIGGRLYRENRGKARTGISRTVFWDYYNNEKSQWQITELLGYLAIKSIVGKQPTYKVGEKLLKARMSGLHAIKDGAIDASIEEFLTESKMRSLKTRLCLNWGMKKSPTKARGFWVSMGNKTSLVGLIIASKQTAKKNKIKRLKDQEREALRQAEEYLKKKNGEADENGDTST